MESEKEFEGERKKTFREVFGTNARRAGANRNKRNEEKGKMKPYWMGLDIGGTKCAVLLATVDGGIHLKDKLRFETQSERGFEPVYAQLTETMDEILRKNGLTYADLNAVGVSYRIGYSVALALRYIPDIQRDYRNISTAQQARGVELGKKVKLHKRVKNSISVLMPLIMSSLSRIEAISNAMELRGFGKEKKRTWYVQRKFSSSDYIAIAFGAVILAASLIITFHDGNRFWNPFV